MNAVVFSFLAAIHFYWLSGGQWGWEAASPPDGNERKVFRPGIGSTLLLAVADQGQYGGQPVADDFDALFNRGIAGGQEAPLGDCTMQDGILLDLGLASTGDQERIRKCRKATRSNSLKKELEI